MAKIRLSVNARMDLEDIKEHIAKDNPTRAQSYIEEIVQHCFDSIAPFPLAFPLTGKKDIRCFPYQKYNVYYRYNNAIDTIDIVHILNSALSKNNIFRRF